MARRPVTSPIARPGRKYVSGIIYLSLVVVIALAVLGVRFLLAH